MAFATLIGCAGGMVRAETVRFLMSGPAGVGFSSTPRESYVIAVSDAALIREARDYLAAGGGVPYLVPHVRIAEGGDGVNRNYAAPGHPAWNWRATELIEWIEFDPSQPRAAVYVPNLDTTPSRVVSELLTGTEHRGPYEDMALLRYPLTMELAGEESAVINVSTRGWVGTGERVLIAGFVVQGDAPRDVLVRAIGPSLAAFGVTDALANPRLAVFRGPALIAVNDDWLDGNFAPPPTNDTAGPGSPPWHVWLYPTRPEEAATRLSLPPGAYTVHVSGVGGTGIALVEVYDFDAMAPR